MAKDCSFDVVSEFDKQELVNAVDQVKRDVASRFDLKDSGSSVELDGDKAITITTSDDMKLRNIYDILQTKLVKRNLSTRILDPQPAENALGGKVRQVINLKKGLNQELAKRIVADIKETKKMSQQELSDKLEILAIYICRGSISRIEDKSRTVTDIELYGLSKVLGVSIDSLFEYPIE